MKKPYSQGFNWVKWTLVFFKILNLFHIVKFPFVHYFIQGILISPPGRHPCFFWYTSRFPIYFCYHKKNLQLRRQSMIYFSQSTRNILNNFHSLISFLRVPELEFSLCWSFGCLKHSSTSPVVYFNCNKNDL